LPSRVAQDVRLLGQDVSGWDREQLEQWLLEQATIWRRDPVPAQIDPVTKGVIPELDGFQLNVEETLRAALSASPGAIAEPSWQWHPAPVVMDDFPLAPLYQGNPGQKAVTFLVNVAWGNQELEQM